MARQVLLEWKLSPGDTVVGSPIPKLIWEQYPNEFEIDVTGVGTSEIFENNPYVTRNLTNAERITVEYPLIHESGGRLIHFIEAQVCDIATKLGLCLDCTINRPDLYVSHEEMKWMNQVQETFGYKGQYWLISSGTKADYTVKAWGHDRYQTVVDGLRNQVQFVQVGAAEHNHRPLEGALDLRGKTDLRQLIRLAFHAQGGIGGVSLLHHIFAAFNKPFVCIASGMEARSWEAYSGRETYLSKAHTLPCHNNGCWKAKVRREEGGDSFCDRPCGDVALCMAMIRPDEVIQAVLDYKTGLVA